MKGTKFFALLLALLLLLTACGGSSVSQKADYAVREEAAAEAPMAMNAASDTLTTSGSGDSTAMPENRKWIITVDLTAETEDLDALMAQLEEHITSLNGYVEDQSIHNGSMYSTRRRRSANLTVRIPAEDVDAFTKFSFESQFQTISSGGAISYVEIPNMRHNLEAMEDVVRFIYDNIQYAEFNTKSDYCQVCGYDGEIVVNEHNRWECPNCGNLDTAKMNVTRRTCGYLGENYWNEGKTREIKSRVLHL